MLTQAQVRACGLVYGNTAKIYDLALLMEASEQRRPFRVIDLGCGTAATVEPVLRDINDVEFVGIEPDLRASSAATECLRGLNATILHRSAYSLPDELIGQFDVALSFSTLEHVYRREQYLRTAASALRDGGLLLMNYDHGHFVVGSRSDTVKNLIGPVLARLGNESKYQRFVTRSAVSSWSADAGLSLREQKFFNLRSLKELSHRVPEDQRMSYQKEWLASELRLNSLLTYHDELASELLTVNLVFARSAARR